MNELKTRGMGWLREPADIRDFWIDIEAPRSEKKGQKGYNKTFDLKLPS